MFVGLKLLIFSWHSNKPYIYVLHFVTYRWFFFFATSVCVSFSLMQQFALRGSVNRAEPLGYPTPHMIICHKAMSISLSIVYHNHNGYHDVSRICPCPSPNYEIWYWAFIVPFHNYTVLSIWVKRKVPLFNHFGLRYESLLVPIILTFTLIDEYFAQPLF